MPRAQFLALSALLFVSTPAVGQADGATAIPLWMGPSSQGSVARLDRPVRSWKALKFNGMVRQQTDFSCGAAALATIFNFAYGKRTTERQVLVNMLKTADADIVKDKGFSLLDMKNYVAAVGMKGEGFEVPFSALEHLKVPGIALLNIKGYKHFVVVRKADEDFIHIADPALGNRVMKRRDFERSWNGVVFVVLGDGYNPDTALRNPPPPVSARRLFDMRSPINDATPPDFGVHSNVAF